MENLLTIKASMQVAASNCSRNIEDIRLMAVTKNQSILNIKPLLQEGHRLFGENRVQEAYTKWPLLKQQFAKIELHFIGHLQTNKVESALALFDTIQTLDSFRLADKLSKEQEKQKKYLNYYIEVNIGEEKQKNGILPFDFDEFITQLRRDYPLNIQGIMCIPPVTKDPTLYFQRMREMAARYHLPEISMGMSNDYILAIRNGATMVRIGTALFN